MIGVVLAGGAGRRMGTAKPEVRVGGRTMFEHVTAALEEACHRIVVSGLAIGGYESVADPEELTQRGPLVGVVAALEAVGEQIVAVATDQPWLRTATLVELIGRAGDAPAVVPVAEGIRQVTCAMYAPSFLPVARDCLPGGSIQSALDRVRHVSVSPNEWSAWGEDGRSWFSVDTPADVDEGVARFGLPPTT